MSKSILDSFKEEYEKDIAAIKNGEKGLPTDDMNDVEKEGRILANKHWQNIDSTFKAIKDIKRYTTEQLSKMDKVTTTPIPNVVVVRAYCPDCDAEIYNNSNGMHKCPKCNSTYIVDKYPHLAVKLPNGDTAMLTSESLDNRPILDEYRDESIPSFDDVPEEPNWRETPQLDDPILLRPEEMVDVKFVK